MKFFARLLLVAVLAAFAASSVAVASGSAEMAATMIASDEAAMDMSECEPCGATDAGERGIACDLVCGAGGFAAVLAPQTQGVIQASRETVGSVVTQDSHGLTGSPPEQPPRLLI